LDSQHKINQLYYRCNSLDETNNKKQIDKKYLINVLNYINFSDETILIQFKHSKYGNIISLRAFPQPCINDTLDCIWIETIEVDKKLKAYEFLHFVIDDGQRLILVNPSLNRMSMEKISFNLPETAYQISSRKIKRHECKNIKAEIIQYGVVFYGSLLDFSAISFKVEISVIPPQSFQWINPESQMTVILKKGQDMVYAGECTVIRQTLLDRQTNIMVFKLLQNKICRLKSKEIRSPRHKLTPSPNITFRHPITEKEIHLPIEDISGSGFSVEEYHNHSVLLPGMLIPCLFIEFASDFKIECKTQVIYNNVHLKEDKMSVRCGISILDLDIQNQVKLSSLLHLVTNKNSYVCNKVDLDALWKFFFETGFIYPKKYAYIYTNKENFKETYEKLYLHSPTIARHFIYQDKDKVQGHISMVRFYENTWLFHHHAAIKSNIEKAGLVVLNQIARYVNDFHCFYATHMHYVISYFSPNNRFPSRVFGSFTKELNNLEGSSLDTFAYFYIPKDFRSWYYSKSWVLDKTQSEDLLELKSFYESQSGGLMLRALDLEPDMIIGDDLSQEYKRIGLKRERHLFSLRKDDILKAVIVVSVSDFGLNMSNLTNCIHVIVLDSVDLPNNILLSNLIELLRYYEQDKIPVLLYPVSYAEEQFIPYDKKYNLWIISTQYTIHFLKYINNLFGTYLQT